MKPLVSSNHAEIASQIWAAFGPERQRELIQAAIETVPPYLFQHEIVDAIIMNAWCLGFHHAMLSIEKGLLCNLTPKTSTLVSDN
jgi:hypothetical protein